METNGLVGEDTQKISTTAIDSSAPFALTLVQCNQQDLIYLFLMMMVLLDLGMEFLLMLQELLTR